MRLSTAFDSVTLYGEDPHTRPDIYGKVGNSGVSIATLDDLKKLYSGFDLCAPNTSVSMTINGPAPMILAFFMNAAIDQQVEMHLEKPAAGKRPKRSSRSISSDGQPDYTVNCPKAITALAWPAGHYRRQAGRCRNLCTIKTETMTKVRGTVQADILKEDQAQNTCIFSTEFAMRMMGDIQQYFVDNGCAISTAFRSPATTSPKPARTRSASWPLPSATA